MWVDSSYILKMIPILNSPPQLPSSSFPQTGRPCFSAFHVFNIMWVCGTDGSAATPPNLPRLKYLKSYFGLFHCLKYE